MRRQSGKILVVFGLFNDAVSFYSAILAYRCISFFLFVHVRMSITRGFFDMGRRSATRGLILALLMAAAWSFAVLGGCGARQQGTPVDVEDVDEEAPAEQVDATLISTIDTWIGLDDREALTALSRDLRDQVALLTFFRSSRAASLSSQWRRIQEALGDATPANDDAHDGGWGGQKLLAWVQALQEWELQGTPNVAAFEGVGCADHAENPEDLPKFAECVLRNIDTAFAQADRSLSDLQRASMGDLSGRARAWLVRRALPLPHVEIGAPSDVTLQLARAWTGLEDAEDTFLADGAVIALRIRGVQVAYRPSVFGEAVFSDGQSHRCTWPGEEILRFASGGVAPSGDALKTGLSELRTLYTLCEALGPDYAQGRANVAIDAGVKWSAAGPLLRELLAMRRQPHLLVRDVKANALSGLPVVLEAQARSSVCGVEAHLRRDGVVLRGGGAAMHLVSWTDKDAFVQLTDQAKKAVARCGEHTVVQTVMDEETVDWGLAVRVMERMSWPQVCTDGAPCVESVLVVGR